MTAALAALRRAGSVALIAHKAPDGDTLGSALALRRALLAAGKQADAFSFDPVPALYAFMPDADKLRFPQDAAQEEFDLAVLVDVADVARTGAEGLWSGARARLVIDHHLVPEPEDGESYIDASAAATGELVYELSCALHAQPDALAAEQLFVALSTDTGHFSFSAVTQATMRIAGELVARGADVAQITKRLYRTRGKPRTLLLGRGLSTLRFYEEDTIATIALTGEDFSACGAVQTDAEGLVNYAAEVEGVQVAVIARDAPGGARVSVRTAEGVNAQAICRLFGGGGHRQASGCTIEGTAQEALARVVEAVRGGAGR